VSERDWRTTIARLEAKADDSATPDGERAALLQKAAELRFEHDLHERDARFSGRVHFTTVVMNEAGDLHISEEDRDFG
jgi:hypothetical protein